MGHASHAKIHLERFLRDCRACGAPSGFVHLPGQDRLARVSCRCEGARCPRCRRPLLLAPSPTVVDDHGEVAVGGAWIRARCAACGPSFVPWE